MFTVFPGDVPMSKSGYRSEATAPRWISAGVLKSLPVSLGADRVPAHTRDAGDVDPLIVSLGSQRPVKVRAGDVAGCTCPAEQAVVLIDPLPDSDIYCVEVRQDCLQPVAMVDPNDVATATCFPARPHDGTALGRPHLRPDGRADVDRITVLAVQVRAGHHPLRYGIAPVGDGSRVRARDVRVRIRLLRRGHPDHCGEDERRKKEVHPS